MLILPPELILEIGDNLAQSDICCLRKVCRRLFHVLKNSVIKPLAILSEEGFDVGDERLKYARALLLRIRPDHVSAVLEQTRRVSFLRILSPLRSLPPISLDLLPGAAAITHLHLAGLRLEPRLLESLPHLVSLKIGPERKRDIYCGARVDAILEALTVNGPSMPGQLIRINYRLESLTIPVDDITVALVTKIVSSFPSLVHLSLFDSMHPSTSRPYEAPALALLARLFTRLTQLSTLALPLVPLAPFSLAPHSFPPQRNWRIPLEPGYNAASESSTITACRLLAEGCSALTFITWAVPIWGEDYTTSYRVVGCQKMSGDVWDCQWDRQTGEPVEEMDFVFGRT